MAVESTGSEPYAKSGQIYDLEQNQGVIHERLEQEPDRKGNRSKQENHQALPVTNSPGVCKQHVIQQDVQEKT